MASWKHRVLKHVFQEGFCFQINVPRDWNIPEFEVVIFKNGIVVSKVIGWDSVESHLEVIENYLRFVYCKD